MKCTNCGQETPRGNFCEHCGARQEIKSQLNIGERLRNGWHWFSNHLTKKVITPLILIIVLAVAGYITYLVNMNLSSPQRVVEKYLAALKDRNYSLAYSFVDGTNNVTMNKEAFAAWQKSEEELSGRISNYEINHEIKDDSLVAWVPIKVQRGKARKESSFKLVRVGHRMGIFPKWKVALTKQNIRIGSDYEGAKIYLDGRDVGLTIPNRLANMLEIKTFAGNHIYELRAPNAKTLVVKRQDDLGSLRLKPTDDIAAEIQKIADTQYEKVMEAYNSNNPGLIQQMGRGAMIELKAKIKDERNRVAKIKTINGKTELSNFEMISPDRLKVNMEFRYLPFDGAYNVKHVYLNVNFVLFKRENGKWIYASMKGGVSR